VKLYALHRTIQVRAENPTEVEYLNWLKSGYSPKTMFVMDGAETALAVQIEFVKDDNQARESKKVRKAMKEGLPDVPPLAEEAAS
jgi:hypothetical protein